MSKLYNPFRAHTARLPDGKYVIRRLTPWGMWLYLDIDDLPRVRWRNRYTLRDRSWCVRQEPCQLLEAWNMLQKRYLLQRAVRWLKHLVGYWATETSRVSVEEVEKHSMLHKLKNPPSKNRSY